MINTQQNSHLTGPYWTPSRVAIESWMEQNKETRDKILDRVCDIFPDYNTVGSDDCHDAVTTAVAYFLPLISAEAEGEQRNGLEQSIAETVHAMLT